MINPKDWVLSTYLVLILLLAGCNCESYHLFIASKVVVLVAGFGFIKLCRFWKVR